MKKVKKPTKTEIVQKWPNGEKEVKYIRDFGSEGANELINQVKNLPKDSGYSYRHV